GDGGGKGGNVGGGGGEIGQELGADGVARRKHDDGDRIGRVLRRCTGQGTYGDDDVWLLADDIDSEVGEAFGPTLGVANVPNQVAPPSTQPSSRSVSSSARRSAPPGVTP